MPPRLYETITTLDDRETIICCRALVVLMDEHMARDPRSGRPSDLTVTDFHQWVGLGGRPVSTFVGALCRGNPTLTAAVGRRLIQACLSWGCDDEVRTVVRLAYAPVDCLGSLAPETIVAALTAVMLWHPSAPTLKALLHSPAVRRFPWLRRQEPVLASEKEPAGKGRRAKVSANQSMPG